MCSFSCGRLGFCSYLFDCYLYINYKTIDAQCQEQKNEMDDLYNFVYDNGLAWGVPTKSMLAKTYPNSIKLNTLATLSG